MNCANGSVYGPSRDVPGATVYLRADCRRLSCDHCGPKVAARYRRAIAQRAGENKLQRHLTLTLDPGKLKPGEDSVAYLRDCWAKFRVYLGRKYEKISYISIVELTKKGLAHLHCLISSYIPQDWIAEAWGAVGGGFVWIRFVDVHRIAAYLTKYVTKELLVLIPAKKKRISTSRNIRLFDPKPKSSGWTITNLSVDTMLEIVAGDCHDFRFDDLGLVSFVVSGGGACV